MKTVYFISSRSCSSDEEKYKNHLLYIPNMSQDGYIYLDKTDYWGQIKSFASDENKINEIEDKVIRRLLRISQNSSSPDDSFIQLIEENRARLVETGIICSDVPQPFKVVYKLNTLDADKQWEWVLFSVHEICDSDNQADVDKIRPLWCNLLIQYILNKIPETENIHLFLHDKDIEGFDGQTQQLIDGIEKCKAKGLISTDVEKAIGKRHLTITFFKHSRTSCVMDVIGSNTRKIEDRIKELQDDFEVAFKNMKGLNELKRLANERKNEIEKKRKEKNNQAK